jgi:hypothetical protein
MHGRTYDDVQLLSTSNLTHRFDGYHACIIPDKRRGIDLMPSLYSLVAVPPCSIGPFHVLLPTSMHLTGSSRFASSAFRNIERQNNIRKSQETIRVADCSTQHTWPANRLGQTLMRLSTVGRRLPHMHPAITQYGERPSYERLR